MRHLLAAILASTIPVTVTTYDPVSVIVAVAVAAHRHIACVVTAGGGTFCDVTPTGLSVATTFCHFVAAAGLEIAAALNSVMIDAASESTAGRLDHAAASVVLGA